MFLKDICCRRVAATMKGEMKKSETGIEAREAQNAESNIKHLKGKRKLILSSVGLPLQLASAQKKGCPWS